MVEDSYTVDIVDFNEVQLVPKDSYTQRLLSFDDILDLLNFSFVSADDPKAVGASSISGDSNTTPTRLVAGHLHFVLNELTKRY